jgi:anti-anti-sigma factor
MEIETAIRDGVAHLRLVGRLVSGPPEATLVDAVDALLARDLVDIVVDVREVPFVDSTGLGTLVRCRNRCAGRSGSFRIEGAWGTFRDVLRMTRLETLLTPEETWLRG